MTFIKKHKILSFAVVSYMMVGLLAMPTVIKAGSITVTYFLEMLQILPAVFVLTSLIQTWVPTRVIIQYFGNGSGFKGFFVSLLIGSLSAGPIYAAFPICKTLLKKGAAIKNVVIILSAWAVVKVPMLINEVKFMGWRYMLIRWTFTIVAIVLMAYLMDRLIDVKSMPIDQEIIGIDHQRCLLCGACVNKYPEVFYKEGNKVLTKGGMVLEDHHRSACPLGAIS